MLGALTGKQGGLIGAVMGTNVNWRAIGRTCSSCAVR
jgi:hypothetical protein